MLRVEPTESLSQLASKLAARIATGEQTALRCAAHPARSRLLLQIASASERAVLLRVPQALDQTERLVLELATALGTDVLHSVDATMRQSPETLSRPLAVLREALPGRVVIVDGWDRLGALATDRELMLAVADKSRELRRWLSTHAQLFALTRGSAPSSAAIEHWSVDDAPVCLANGTREPTNLWERFASDVATYEVALAMQALQGSSSRADADEEAADPLALRAAVVELLPDSQRQVLMLLAVHERPLPEPVLSSLVAQGEVALDEGVQLGLWHRTPAGLVTDDGWSEWCRRSLGPARLREAHLRLATHLAREARPDDPAAGLAGLSILEAHRHFLAAGEPGRAHDFARYGVTLLVEAARNRSLAGDYVGAADLYESVVASLDRDGVPAPRKLQAYARHYLHFNRARANREPLESTERGYRAALEAWPGNALFWSRLVRVLCYRSEPARALDVLAQAMQTVEDHPQKRTVLTARTVQGLLRRGHVADAVRVWDRYEPDTPQAREVLESLAHRLARGWQAEQLHLASTEPLFFVRPLELRIERIHDGWLAQLPVLDAVARGDFPIDALQSLVTRVRSDTRALLLALSATLDSATRLRKQRLLANVDVIASRLDAEAPSATWLFGDLERDARGQIWLRVGGAIVADLEIPEALGKNLVVDAHPHFALVETGPGGVPTGRVLKLEPACRRPEDEVWEAWRQRLGDVG